MSFAGLWIALRAVAEKVSSLTKNIASQVPLLGEVETWRILFTFVSFITTWWGSAALYGTYGGNAGATIWLLRIMLPLTVAGGLHVLIFRLLHRWRKSKFQIRFLRVALGLQFLAVFLSANTHWLAMRAPHETVEAYTRSQTATMRSLESFGSSYRYMARETKDLADYSRDEAKNEAKGPGDTCGQAVGGKRLYRWRLRTDDQATYSNFESQIAGRATDLDRLLGRATALNADNAEASMADRDALRQIVDEAATVKGDPMLMQLKQEAQTRIKLGQSNMPIPLSQRRPHGPTTFTCPDRVLEQHLTAVVNAIDGLKPPPEPDLTDYRDPQAGLALFAPRFFHSAMVAPRALATFLLPPSRSQLEMDRKAALAGSASSDPDGLRPEDVPPVALAFAIEGLLLMLFRFGGDGGEQGLGIVRLREFLLQRSDGTIDEAWQSISGATSASDLREALRQCTKFDDKGAMIVVRLYTDSTIDYALHHFMEVLTQAGLARRSYTGKWLKSMFTQGWSKTRIEGARGEGPVRVYRMSDVDYLEIVRDSSTAKRM